MINTEQMLKELKRSKIYERREYMKCTGKEQLSCNVEKMGCRGCAFDDTEKIIQEIIALVEEAERRGWADTTVEISKIKVLINLIK